MVLCITCQTILDTLLVQIRWQKKQFIDGLACREWWHWGMDRKGKVSAEKVHGDMIPDFPTQPISSLQNYASKVFDAGLRGSKGNEAAY